MVRSAQWAIPRAVTDCSAGPVDCFARNNCRTKYMLTNNVDYHDLGADDFTRRKLDVSYSGSPDGQTPSAAPSGSTHPTDPHGQADAEPHRSLSSQTGCVRLCGPGRAPGATCTASTPASTASPVTPQPALLKDGGRLASSLGAAGDGPGRFRFNVMGKPRPGNVQRLASSSTTARCGSISNRSIRSAGPCRRRQTLHTRGAIARAAVVREQRGDLAAPRAPADLYACRHGCLVADDPPRHARARFCPPGPGGHHRPARRLRRGTFAAGHVPVQSLPVVRHIEAELSTVLAQWPGLAVVGICTNDVEAYPDDRPERLAEQAQRAGWVFPYLVDHDQQLGRAHNAACTPDFFLYDRQRRLAYRGAFDESTPGNGKPVTGGLLHVAVEQVLAGKPVPEPHKPSMGCSIKWRS